MVRISRRRLMHKLVAHRVVLHTRDGQTFEGILDAVHRDCVVLTASTPIVAEKQIAPLEGHHVIVCDNISSLQILGMGGT